MTDDLPVHVGPDLLDHLDAAVHTVEHVAPNLFDRAHPAGDLTVQREGHFALGALPAHGEKCGRVWAFLDLGQVLAVLTCTLHGNTIDPARARALGEHLITWADRKEGRPA